MLARNFDCGGVVICLNQAPKNCRTRNVAALANIRKKIVRSKTKGLETCKTKTYRYLRHRPWCNTIHGVAKCAYMIRSGTAATADQVHESAARELANNLRHFLRRFIVLTKFIRQPGVRVCTDAGVGDARKFGNVLAQIGGAKCAIQPDHKRFDVAH